MAARARHDGGDHLAAKPKARTRPQAATAHAAAAPSPALMLQQALYSELAETEIKKWPPVATVGFIVGTCGAFWAAVAFGVAHALG